MRYSQYGESDLQNIRLVPEIQVVEYDFSDLAADHTLKIPIPANTVVLSVAHETVVAFSGGTPALTIGDADDPDGYGAAAHYTIGTVGNFVSSGGALGAMTAVTTADTWTPRPFAAGKKYNAAGYILLTHAAGLTVGTGKVHIMSYTTVGNWRLPAQ